ncbi:MAG: RND family efflux transporter MFP subunit [Candidatus Krumholzibacteriia bacterium]
MSAKTIRNLIIAAIILVVGFLVTGALIKSRTKPERVAAPPVEPLVTAFTISPDAGAVRITSFGSVEAGSKVTLIPQVSGDVLSTSVLFNAGSYIKLGDVLLKIDETDYVLALANARANVAQKEYELALAEEEASVALREWERIDMAGEEEPTALVMREPQLKLAAANLAAAKAAQNQAQVNLDRCTIKAPFDGRVLNADVDAGQFLQAGTVIGELYATDLAEVTVNIADDDLAWITLKATTSVPVIVSAQFAGQEHQWEGNAVRLGGAVDPRSRLVPVVIEIPNPYVRVGDRPALIEGMFVEVAFEIPTQDGVAIIPRTALRPNNKVWVIGSDGKLDIRQVTVSRAGIDQALITEGLQIGERVCTSNLQFVTQGMAVRIGGER